MFKEKKEDIYTTEIKDLVSEALELEVVIDKAQHSLQVMIDCFEEFAPLCASSARYDGEYLSTKHKTEIFSNILILLNEYRAKYDDVVPAIKGTVERYNNILKVIYCETGSVPLDLTEAVTDYKTPADIEKMVLLEISEDLELEDDEPVLLKFTKEENEPIFVEEVLDLGDDLELEDDDLDELSLDDDLELEDDDLDELSLDDDLELEDEELDELSLDDDLELEEELSPFGVPKSFTTRSAKLIDFERIDKSTLPLREKILFYILNKPMISPLYFKQSNFVSKMGCNVNTLKSTINKLIDDKFIIETKRMFITNGFHCYYLTSTGVKHLQNLTLPSDFIDKTLKETLSYEETLLTSPTFRDLFKVFASSNKVKFEKYDSTVTNNHIKIFLNNNSCSKSNDDTFIKVHGKKYSIAYHLILDWIDILRFLRNKKPKLKYNCYISALQTCYKKDPRTYVKYLYYFAKNKEPEFKINHQKVADILLGGAVEPSQYVIEKLLSLGLLEKTTKSFNSTDYKITELGKTLI